MHLIEAHEENLNEDRFALSEAEMWLMNVTTHYDMSSHRNDSGHACFVLVALFSYFYVVISLCFRY